MKTMRDDSCNFTYAFSNSAQHSGQSGLTLIELLATTAISAILLSISVPSMTEMIERYQARAEFARLETTLNHARNFAVVNQDFVTFCPLDSQGKCHSQWHETITSFVDANDNRQFDDGELMLQQISAIDHPDKSRSYGNKRAVTFDPQGYSTGFNSTLQYCYAGALTHYGVLIVANTGRIRNGEDSNDNGIPELANGQDQACQSN